MFVTRALGSSLWGFHFSAMVAEAPLLKCEATLDLLYLDAESRVELGAITPTDAQLEKLDDFANPEFLAKKQYVELAQQVRF
jgi:hypothetical protein